MARKSKVKKAKKLKNRLRIKVMIPLQIKRRDLNSDHPSGTGKPWEKIFSYKA